MLSRLAPRPPSVHTHTHLAGGGVERCLLGAGGYVVELLSLWILGKDHKEGQLGVLFSKDFSHKVHKFSVCQ